MMIKGLVRDIPQRSRALRYAISSASLIMALNSFHPTVAHDRPLLAHDRSSATAKSASTQGHALPKPHSIGLTNVDIAKADMARIGAALKDYMSSADSTLRVRNDLAPALDELTFSHPVNVTKETTTVTATQYYAGLPIRGGALCDHAILA